MHPARQLILLQLIRTAPELTTAWVNVLSMRIKPVFMCLSKHYCMDFSEQNSYSAPPTSILRIKTGFISVLKQNLDEKQKSVYTTSNNSATGLILSR